MTELRRITATNVEATEAVRLLDLIEMFPPDSEVRQAMLYILEQTYAGNNITILKVQP